MIIPLAVRDNKGRFIQGHMKVSNYVAPKGTHHSPATEFKKGQISPNKKDDIIIFCQVCGKELRIWPCDVGRKKFCSKVCFFKGRVLKETFESGEKHPGYIDGRAGLGYKNEFHRMKMIAIKRDDYTCQFCGKRGCHLDVHHKDYDKNNNILDNLITLCHRCHMKTNFGREKWKRFFINGELLGVMT